MPTIKKAAAILGSLGGRVTGPSKRRGGLASTSHYRDLAAKSAHARRVRYERKGEWGGYTIRASKSGWIVEQWSAIQGELTGTRDLVPYASSGYGPEADLAAAHNDTTDVGQYIAYIAWLAGPENPQARVIRAGHLVR